MTKSLAFIIFPGFQIVDLAAATVFELANKLTNRSSYEINIYSEHGGKVPSSAGIGVDSLKFDRESFDSVLVCGGMEQTKHSPEFLDSLRAMSAASRRTAPGTAWQILDGIASEYLARSDHHRHHARH